MIIKKTSGRKYITDTYLSQPPDPLLLESEKSKPDYIKWVMDYYFNMAYRQFTYNRETIGRNYDFMKGIIDARDFYEEDKRVESFVESIVGENTLPSYIKSYANPSQPINDMVGELLTRADDVKFRAFDSLSQQQEEAFKTDLMQKYILQEAYQIIVNRLMIQGQDLSQIDPQQLQQLSYEEVKDQLTDFTTEGEIWANETKKALKAELRIQDKRAEAFRDLAISNFEGFHVYEDSSRRGFNVEVINPIEYFDDGDKNEKYSSKKEAVGLLRGMSMTQLIDRYKWLTDKEIKHLKECAETLEPVTRPTSNLFTNHTGDDSIRFASYDKMAAWDREIAAYDVAQGRDIIDFLNGNQSTVNYRYAVTEVYFWGKTKVGKLEYYDKYGDPQTALVDENYVEGSPNEISIEWGWANRRYHGVKISNDIYHLEPYDTIDAFPIVGVRHEIKNTESVSMLDMFKPYYTLINVCYNTAFDILGKDKGIMVLMNQRYIPSIKDGDEQDAIEFWEEEIRRSGTMFVDDSPENLGGPASFNQFTKIDASRIGEVQARFQMAMELKQEVMNQFGFTPQRLGAPSGAETAEGVRTSMSQSFAQTEPWFQQEKVVADELYQILIDIAKEKEANKESVTLQYINDAGMNAYISISGEELSNTSLHLVAVSSNEENLLMQRIQGLAQPMMQNGATVDDIATLFSSNSVRQWQKAAKTITKKREEFEEKQMQLQQQQIQAEQQTAQQQLQYQAQKDQAEMQQEAYLKEKELETKITVAQITAASFNNSESSDTDKNGVYDVLEAEHTIDKMRAASQDQSLKAQQISLQEKKILSDRELKLRQMAVDLKNQDNDLKISKIQSSAKKSQNKK